MLAARLHATGEPLRLEEVPLPEPRRGQVRIRVAGCGVCRTDLHVVDGTQRRVILPRTLGHEVAGRIDAFGRDARPILRRAGLADGDAVLVYGGWGCGRCRECQAGAGQRCPESVAPGFQADGGYAEAMLVPDAGHLEPLGSVDPVHAAPLADAGATAHRAVTRARPWLTAGARVAVIGGGGVGQLVLQLLRAGEHGGELMIGVAEPDPRRRGRATRIAIGVAVADGESLARELGGPADAVIDVVGSDATLEVATRLVAPDGVIVLVGEAGGSVRVGFDGLPLEAWVTTVAWASRDDLRHVVRLAAAGRLEWATEAVPLRDANEAHARLRAGDVDGRLVLIPD